MARTPTPWLVVQNGGAVADANGGGIAALWRDGAERLANAEFIVRACNAHQELVDAAKDILISIGGVESTDIFCADLRKAIAKAEGK